MYRLNRTFASMCAAALCALAGVSHAQTPAFDHPGQVDLTLGTNTFFPGTISAPNGCVISDAVRQADGAIVRVGTDYSGGSPGRICLTRVNQNGTTDTSFGANGTVRLLGATTSSKGISVVVQSTGRIVVSAQCVDTNPTTPEYYCLFGYLPSGAQDNTFGSNGKVSAPSLNNPLNFPVSTTPWPRSLRIRSDDSLIIASTCWDGSTYSKSGETVAFEPDPNRFWVQRVTCVDAYTPNGARKTNSFGAGGRKKLFVGLADQFNASVSILPDDRVAIAFECGSWQSVVNIIGPTGTVVATQIRNSSFSWCAAVLTANGSFDSTFGGTDGRTILDRWTNANTQPTIAMQADGKFVVGGNCWYGGGPYEAAGSPRFCLARLLASGSVDTNFGNIGGGRSVFYSRRNYDRASQVLIQEDQKILVAGDCTIANKRGPCAARVLPHGELDLSYGIVGNGFSVQRDDRGVDGSAYLQPDGKVLLSNSNVMLRLYGGGTSPCHDIDGDNFLRPTTDLLIQNRISRGVRGDDVVAGISFSPFATRTTWPAIRDHLEATCGYRFTLPEGFTSPTGCSADINGDGQVRSEDDGVLQSRMSLGYTGDAVLADVPFPANAQRKTWPAIRDFMLYTCGVSVGQ
jgi:uncharacterized delta-60 repeat protein